MRNSKRLRTGYLAAIIAAVMAICGLAFTASAGAETVNAARVSATSITTTTGVGTTHLTATPHASVVFWLKNNNTALCMDDSSAYGLRGYGCNSSSIAGAYQVWYVNYTSGQGWWFQNVNTGLCIDDSSAYGLRGYGRNASSRASGYQTWTSLV